MLWGNNFYYVFIFIFALLISYFISYYFNNICLDLRRGRNESKNLHIKQLVKILMSKNEIFQSNKVNNEINILDKYMKECLSYNKKMSTSIFSMFRIPDGIILSFSI
jgi:hypothetical protein